MARVEAKFDAVPSLGEAMKRREFIYVLSGALIATSRDALAQTTARLRRVGILLPYPKSDSEAQTRLVGFRQELRRLGWIEGQNLQIDLRWSTDNMDRVRADAAELVSLKPDVIFFTSQRVAPVMQQLTRAIPTVFVGVNEPVEQRLVISLARPGGNLTGFALNEPSTISKSLQILKEIAPNITRVALIFNPDNPSSAHFSRVFEDAAAKLGIQPTALPVHQSVEIERAIEDFSQKPNGGVLYPSDLTIVIHRDLIVSLAARHRLPACYPQSIIARSGGLVSYGADLRVQYRQAASYVDRILRGEKPGDMPVQQSTKYELVINLKTAKALGLTVPQTLQVAADEVIE
jgi:putative tryptophan/tyrosine transport system substrate-binding protein